MIKRKDIDDYSGPWDWDFPVDGLGIDLSLWNLHHPKRRGPMVRSNPASPLLTYWSHIHNPEKRRYAYDYIAYKNDKGPEPNYKNYKLGAMAQQAVRLQVDEIIKTHPWYKSNPITYICKQCKKPFVPNVPGQQFCSEHCYNVAIGRSPFMKKNPDTLICVECGEEIDELQHNFGTPEFPCCLHCYQDAQEIFSEGIE